MTLLCEFNLFRFVSVKYFTLFFSHRYFAARILFALVRSIVQIKHFSRFAYFDYFDYFVVFTLLFILRFRYTLYLYVSLLSFVHFCFIKRHTYFCCFSFFVFINKMLKQAPTHVVFLLAHKWTQIEFSLVSYVVHSFRSIVSGVCRVCLGLRILMPFSGDLHSNNFIQWWWSRETTEGVRPPSADENMKIKQKKKCDRRDLNLNCFSFSYFTFAY